MNGYNMFALGEDGPSSIIMTPRQRVCSGAGVHDMLPVLYLVYLNGRIDGLWTSRRHISRPYEVTVRLRRLIHTAASDSCGDRTLVSVTSDSKIRHL